MDEYDPRGERATRDIVSRGMYEQMRQGKTGPHGELYITMRHLDPAMVRQQFKGMVDRCRDVGFDLVGGLVNVVPTAHYMMGGVRFDTDCRTEMPGLFVAGEDSGGVHGANRLGGNGVANSTVFGGVAGDVMPGWIESDGDFVGPDESVIEAAVDRALTPFKRKAGDVNIIRERLYDIMWDEVGIIRSADVLERAQKTLEEMQAELDETGIPEQDMAFNLKIGRAHV